LAEAAVRREGPSPAISTLFPHLFLNLRPTFDGNSPVIMAGSLLIMNDVYILPMAEGLLPNATDNSRQMLCSAFGGHALLSKIAKTAPQDYHKLLWTPGRECVVLIGSCNFKDSMDEVLHLFEVTHYGNARVNDEWRFTLITLSDFVEALREGTLESDMPATAVGSAMLSISRDASIKEAVSAMLEHRVRRLFIKGTGTKYVSDRIIISYMFSGERIALARRNPEKWFDAKVEETKLREAPTYDAGGTLSGAASAMGPRPDDCLVTSDGKVVSRWDMIMKPWKAGELGPPHAKDEKGASGAKPEEKEAQRAD
jgi:CBS domain-containing protein